MAFAAGSQPPPPELVAAPAAGSSGRVAGSGLEARTESLWWRGTGVKGGHRGDWKVGGDWKVEGLDDRGGYISRVLRDDKASPEEICTCIIWQIRSITIFASIVVHFFSFLSCGPRYYCQSPEPHISLLHAAS